MGFNRNILGCKEKNINKFIRAMRDLIETYWDVKSGARPPAHLPLLDLIETYWDVK